MIDSSGEHDRPPKAFISYSWSSDEHQARVVALASRLMEDGVDVLLDVWDLKPGQDKYAYMEKMVTDESVEFVLMVCDAEYKRKADAREGGVGTETLIISQDVYERADQTKFIPVLFERGDMGEVLVPTFVRSRMYIDMSSLRGDTEGYEELVRFIYKKPRYQKPECGSPPAFIEDDGRIVTRTSRVVARIEQAIDIGAPNGTIQRKSEEFFNELERGLSELNFDPDKATTGGAHLDDAVMQAIDRSLPYRDDVVLAVEILADAAPGDVLFRSLHGFFARHAHLFINARDSGTADHCKFVVHEMFLYVMTTLVLRRKYEVAHALVSRPYFTKSGRTSEQVLAGYDVLSRPLGALRDRQARLTPRRVSLHADQLKNRESTRVPFNELISVDLLLYIRSILTEQPKPKNEASVRFSGFDLWHPRTLVYAGDAHSLPLFARATSRSEFEAIGAILEVSSAEELRERCSKVELSQYLRSQHHFTPNVPRLINLGGLGSIA